MADGTSLRRLPVPGVPFIGEPLAWSPDGRVLAGGVFKRVVRIDAKSGEFLEDLALSDLNLPISLTYDSDGKFAVAGYPGKAWTFDASDRPIRTYGPPLNPYYVAAWGPAGTLVLPNTTTGEIRLVEPVADRQVGPSFAGPAGLALVAVESDGRGGVRGVAASGDNVIYLWDAGTGQPIGEPFRASSLRQPGTVTNFKNTVASDPEHHRMMIWDLDPAVWRVPRARPRDATSPTTSGRSSSPRASLTA